MGNMAAPPSNQICLSNATNTAICQIDSVADYAHRKSRVKIKMNKQNYTAPSIILEGYLETRAASPTVLPLDLIPE
jgi:hypothetical protein